MSEQGSNGAARAVPRAATVAATGATRAAPDWDLVRKRNNIEKLKFEKHPLRIVDEIEELRRALATIRHGSVTLIVQDGRIVQIDTTQKVRLERRRAVAGPTGRRA